MTWTKQLIGWHDEDAGPVYRTSNPNTLFSNIACELCGKSTANSNLNVTQNVSTDLTTICTNLGGEPSGTDREWLEAFKLICNAWNTSPGYPVAYGYVDVNNPFECLKTWDNAV